MVNTPQDFVHRLAEIQMPLVFNPYKDVCPIHDLPDAPIIRQRNLVQWLEAARRWLISAWGRIRADIDSTASRCMMVST